MTDTSNEPATREAAVANYTDIQHHSGSDELAERLESWLATRLPDGADPRVTGFDSSAANGMSSDTVLFDASWTDPDAGGPERRDERFVARIAPEPTATPVFPRYDLAGQFATMTEVAAHTDVPVPETRWCEPDPGVLGRPFFVMARVDGSVPPDMLPYTFGDNWVADGTDDERATMQASMVEVLAGIHGIDDAPRRFAHLELPTSGSTPLARHLGDVADWYEWSCADSATSSLVETALERLGATLPDDPGPTVLSWGDSRIGNVLFDQFAPVGVLDWEMAALGPRELDLAWLTYSHTVFQDLATGLGVAGLPDLLRLEDVAAAYETATGHQPRHLEWHLLFAATRWAIVFLRTGARQAAVSANALPDDGNELLHNRPSLERLLA